MMSNRPSGRRLRRPSSIRHSTTPPLVSTQSGSETVRTSTGPIILLFDLFDKILTAALFLSLFLST